MNKEKNLYLCFFVILLICSLGIIVRAGDSISLSAAPDGWPKRLGKRKLYSSTYGYVYAWRKSAADEVNKIIGVVVKELDRDSTANTTKGLILVMDTKEKPLFDIQKVIEVVRHADKQQESEKSQDALKSIVKAKEKIEQQGMDMDLLLSIVPMPIEPNMLSEIVNEFGQDLDQQIDYCVIMPSGRNIKYGWKKIFDAVLKKKKISLAARLVLLPLMPFIEQKVVDRMKKGRQVVLYQILLDKQEGLSKLQKEDKVKAYKRKLGIDDKSGPNRDIEKNGQTKEISTPRKVELETLR